MARTATRSRRPTARPARPGPRWRRRKDARPEEIIRAALEVFADRGFAATKLEEVARRAGVTKGTIYLYFANKESLFKAIIRETLVPVIAQGEALAQSFTGSARDLFERLERGYSRRVGEDPASSMPRLLITEPRNLLEVFRISDAEAPTREDRLIACV